VKHSRLVYGFIVVFGFALLTLFFRGVNSFLNSSEVYYPTNSISETIFAFMSSTPLLVFVFWFCLPLGTVLFIAGICGIGRQYFRDNKKVFTVLAIFVILFCIIFALLTIWMSGLAIAY
jgi:hypothetical protein